MDPRRCNNILPNDAVMTRRFGARSYLTDCYPEYTWYNGNWFKISDELKFEELDDKNLRMLHNNYSNSTLLEKGYADSSIILDDLFVPFKVFGTRVFVRVYKPSRGYYFIIYYPHIQTATPSNGSHYYLESYYRYKRALPQGIVCEDPDFWEMLYCIIKEREE
jgi:hypothetical protein